jgi:hypothetical protein
MRGHFPPPAHTTACRDLCIRRQARRHNEFDTCANARVADLLYRESASIILLFAFARRAGNANLSARPRVHMHVCGPSARRAQCRRRGPAFPQQKLHAGVLFFFEVWGIKRSLGSSSVLIIISFVLGALSVSVHMASVGLRRGD